MMQQSLRLKTTFFMWHQQLSWEGILSIESVKSVKGNPTPCNWWCLLYTILCKVELQTLREYTLKLSARVIYSLSADVPKVLRPEPALRGHPSFQSYSPLITGSTDDCLLLVRRKLPLSHWPSLEIHAIGTERRAQVRPNSSTLEQ